MNHNTNRQLNNIIYEDSDGNLTEEVWKDVVGFESKYQVSDLGRIKSKIFKTIKRDLILKLSIKKTGYLEIRFIKNKQRVTTQVQRVVAKSFLGEIPKGYVVDHINNISSDNRLINLQIITKRKNSTKDRINKTGFTRVNYKKDMGKFISSITIEKENIHLGSFLTKEEAYEAYQTALYNWENFNIKPERAYKSSKYKGVSLNKTNGKYKVNLTINKINYYLGEYESEIEAFNVYTINKNNYYKFNIVPKYENPNPYRSSQYKYIVFYKPYNKWLSKFKDVDGKIKHIGYFETEDEAYLKQQEKLTNI